jgi:hypothetical protein
LNLSGKSKRILFIKSLAGIVKVKLSTPTLLLLVIEDAWIIEKY